MKNNLPKLKTSIPDIKFKKSTLILVGVSLVALISFIVILRLTEPSDKFSAIFLQSGQVYFGQITNEDSEYVTIKKIYYLQTSTPDTNAVTNPLTGAETFASESNVNYNLIKRGKELHSPEDIMRVSKEYILLIETLRPDSKILETINSGK